MKAVYIGAGCDIRPVRLFRGIKNFYFFDGQPYSEFGTKQCGTIMKDGSDGYSRPNFISNLDESMSNNNMKLVNVFNHIRVYSNGEQRVYYHTNTAIPEHYERIKNTIRNFDTLIVAGHDPDSIFLDATRKKINFIGCEGTVFQNEYDNLPDNGHSIIYRMHNDNIRTKFNSFTYMKNDGRKFNFDSWNDYYLYVLK